MDFRLHAWRFEFQAADCIHFPPGKSGNILRGAFGTIFRRLACTADCPGASVCRLRDTCPYARIFEPRAKGGPAGLADSPRPFVFRAASLGGRTIPPGETFHFDLHVFDTAGCLLPYFVRAFAEVAREGLGAGRGRAILHSVVELNERGVGRRLFDSASGGIDEAPVLSLSLNPPTTPVDRLLLTFLTPTELKADGALADRPEFQAVIARARDRVATLSRLYSGKPLDFDYREMGTRAETIRIVRCDVRYVDAARRSTRTGEMHPLGGFIGTAEYSGDLAEFVPLLRVAQWTGIGRHTVWGKGALRVETDSLP